MRNLRSNLVKWQEVLEDDKKESCLKALTSGECSGVEEMEKERRDSSGRDSSDSSSSATDLPQPITTPQIVVGRRHSLPLNVPSMVPRTIIRRESMSKDGQYPIVLETVHMEGMSLSTVSQTETDMTGSMTQAGHVPVLTNMSDVTAIPSSHRSVSQSSGASKSSKRRMSLPGLLSHHPHTQRYKHQVSTLQPLPATPSLEELRLPVPTASSSGSTDNPSGSGTVLESHEQSSGTGNICDTDQVIPDAKTGDSRIGGDGVQSYCASSDPPLSTFNINLSSSFSTNKSVNRNVISNESLIVNSDAIVHLSKRMCCSKPVRNSRRASLDNSACVNFNINDIMNLNKLKNNTNLNISGSSNNLQNNCNLNLSNSNLSNLNNLEAAVLPAGNR